MNYKEYKLRDGYIIDLVKEIIEVEGMNTENRTHDLAHRRYYLMYFLRRNTGLSLDAIGKLFNKHHATVINALRRHYEFIQFADDFYLKNIEGIKEYLEGALIQE